LKYKREFIGEFMGTFILVLFGCGSVAVATLFEAHSGLFQIALVWGIACSLAIYATRNLSCAHLNPAVTIAMAASGRMDPHKVPAYIAAQLFGAFAAGLVVYVLFAPSIAACESANGIVRGTCESVKTAKIFGEYYSQTGSGAVVSMPLAMLAEGFGTFMLVLLIFSLTEGCNVGRPSEALAPLFIGLAVSSVICLVAPLTQAGLNPARDFGPRMVAYIFNWGAAAFPDKSGGFIWVYVAAPIAGGLAAGVGFTKVVEPLMMMRNNECCSKNKP
jgi:glycerol uptake facilitator protein